MTSNPVHDLIAGYVGQRIPGGCEHCDAYQTVNAELLPTDIYPAAAGVDGNDAGYSIVVHHDDWCPWWERHQNRKARRDAIKRAKRSRNRG